MITYLFVGLGALSLLAFLFFRDKKSSMLAISLKTLTSIFFIVTGLVAFHFVKQVNETKQIYYILVIIGLLFGLFGDFILDLKIYFKGLNYQNHMKDSGLSTYVGMGAFAVGHILYITAALILNPNNLMNLLWASLGAIPMACFIVFVGGTILNKLHYSKFFWPTILYCFLLSNFVILSLILMINNLTTANILRFIGATAFLISDLILSITYFSPEYKYKERSILKNPESRLYIISNHVIYYVAQFVLAILLMFI